MSAPTETMTLGPGRAMDTAVAVAAMNYRLPTDAEVLEEAERVWKRQPGCVHFMRGFSAWREKDGTFRWELACPRYSTDIGAAWRVVERMESRGWDVIVSVLAEGFTCTMVNEDRRAFAAVDPREGHAALAICRAALNAMEADRG